MAETLKRSCGSGNTCNSLPGRRPSHGKSGDSAPPPAQIGRSEDTVKNFFSHFKFPPPPILPVNRPLSVSSFGPSLSDSDSQSDCGNGIPRSSPIPISQQPLSFRGYQSDGSPSKTFFHHKLPPIGVFWYIENCQVPKGRSAIAVAQAIREKFSVVTEKPNLLLFVMFKKSKNPVVIQELNDAQVNLIHVAATCKNAADEKLRQSIRRYADIHGCPATIILITSDINFASDLNDLRHRKKIHVVLLHNDMASEALKICANETYNFSELMETLPPRSESKVPCIAAWISAWLILIACLLLS